MLLAMLTVASLVLSAILPSLAPDGGRGRARYSEEFGLCVEELSDHRSRISTRGALVFWQARRIFLQKD